MPSLADVLLHTVDGVFAVDADQRINYWNAGCSQLLGIPAEEALGRPCNEVIKGMDPFGAPFCRPGCCVARLGQSERAPQTFSLCTVDAEGEKLPLSVSIILVPSQQSDVWISVHLLRRDPAVDPLEAIDWPVRNKQGSAAKRPGCRGARDALAPLSKREQEIVELLAEGLSTSAIAELLAIRPVTVRNHIQHIQQKLGVHSKLEAVAYMYRHNLLRTRVPKSTRTA